VFGRRAGRSASERAALINAQPFRREAARDAIELATAGRDAQRTDLPNSAEMILSLQDTMADDVGPFRTGPNLERAIARLDRLARDLGERPFGDRAPFDMQRIDWLDLRNMLLVARTVARAALRRTESRGAHQREDFPGMLPQWRVNQVVRWRDGALDISSAPPADMAAAQ
jgi:succinate dehydrogenase / fumarate reductase flavoprotein subunit